MRFTALPSPHRWWEEEGEVEEVVVEEDLVVIEKDAGVVVITRTQDLVHAKHILLPSYSLSPQFLLI